VKGGMKDPDGVKVQDRMNWTPDEFEVYMNTYMYETMKKAPLLPCAKEVISKLKKMGHNLVVITARGTCDSGIAIDLAKEMLEKNNIEIDKACYRSNDKLVDCTRENIDYMIDDSYSNVDHLSKNGVKCLYFRDYGSQDLDRDNVTHVRNWGEILRFFVELEKNK
jgi:uncharacterized HAD superfamily protein